LQLREKSEVERWCDCVESVEEMEGREVCRGRRPSEGVVVAPGWWMGGQPPPKIKILNFGQSGFFLYKIVDGGHGFKPPPLPLNFWATLGFSWAKEKGGGWGSKPRA
jgi:hypothetical protein